MISTISKDAAPATNLTITTVQPKLSAMLAMPILSGLPKIPNATQPSKKPSKLIPDVDLLKK